MLIYCFYMFIYYIVTIYLIFKALCESLQWCLAYGAYRVVMANHNSSIY